MQHYGRTVDMSGHLSSSLGMHAELGQNNMKAIADVDLPDSCSSITSRLGGVYSRHCNEIGRTHLSSNKYQPPRVPENDTIHFCSFVDSFYTRYKYT